MKKISVTVITKNEEKNISECLRSVDWADEIIVVDSESSDRTVALAKQFTDKIFIRNWEGYVPQKRYALSLARNEWVLSLDADERVTPELKEEIINLNPGSYTGFRIRRKNFLLNKEIKSCGWGNDDQLRLFKKDKTGLTDRLVHESFTVTGNIGKLKAPMLHFTVSSISNYLSKINYYSSLKAEELFNNKKKVNTFSILLHTTSAFFTFFIIRGGFRDGIYGLVVSLLHSYTKLLNYLKLWELQFRNIK